MNSGREMIELVEVEPSRFDEIDVARCVARMGGSMRGRQIFFPNRTRLAAAFDELAARFGAGYFDRSDEAAVVLQ